MRTPPRSYRETADEWQRSIPRWTITHNGPLSPDPYFLRLTVDGNADAGTTYTIGDGGPTIDQRAVVDPSFLELVRLGVLPAGAPEVRSTLPVVDRELGVDTPNGTFWHRYNFDGYGETPDGGPFDGPGTAAACGRSSPASAASTSCRPATPRRPRSASRRWRRPRTPAACCPSRCGTTTRRRAARLRAGDRHVLGHAARLDARAADPPGLVARRRPPGRAAADRRRPLPLRTSRRSRPPGRTGPSTRARRRPRRARSSWRPASPA